MRQVDPDRVRDLLGRIAEARQRLADLGRLSESEFLGDFRNTTSAKYLLVVVTEASIDICNHFVARLGGRAPKDYADCFSILSELNVVQAELAEKLRAMARFRNRLVHMYWDIDDKRVYRILHENVSDLDAFRASIAQRLQNNPPASSS